MPCAARPFLPAMSGHSRPTVRRPGAPPEAGAGSRVGGASAICEAGERVHFVVAKL
jgi:hypothetical protein